MMPSRLWFSALTLAILLLSASSSVHVSAASKNGTFTFSFDGYTVTGKLTDAIITHEGTVQLQMSIDQTISTATGVVHIVGNGVWNGKTDFAVFNGLIENVKGMVQACLLFVCQSADFTGSGSWTGMLAWSKISGSEGSGTFQVTLNFTGSSPAPTGPVSVPGNWKGTFTI